MKKKVLISAIEDITQIMNFMKMHKANITEYDFYAKESNAILDRLLKVYDIALNVIPNLDDLAFVYDTIIGGLAKVQG